MKKTLFVLLAGVAAGLLLAPDKGSKTWKKLSDGLDDAKNKAMDEMNSLVDKGKALANKEIRKARKMSKGW